MTRGLRRFRVAYERFLEYLVILLMAVLAVEVTLGVVFRTVGQALVWYDEIASVLLAWLTYYGAALAAIKRAHIGFPGLVRSLKPALRLPVVLLAEALVFAFFGLLGWVGYSVLEVLATDFLVSLPSISVMYTQSVIPLSSALFIVAEALVLPELLREARGGKAVEDNLAAEASH
ncbi:MAG: TRAP transporter small permease subunit [Betaproteobacteria bacterium]|nr:TRAP transporter small permease subunit [Betaproteobacteria bacterium]